MSSKMRDVIESLLELLDDFGINEEIVSISNENIVHRESLKTERTLAVLRKAKSALAEPLRNCDVGTAEEQELRFMDFCDAYNDVPCTKCPVCRSTCCKLAWAQMPYESEVSDDTQTTN
jgi:hypothetical protein